jgi:PAS domain S-box-containing protein
VRSWIRFATSARFAVPALIVLLGAAGYLITASTIRGDRKAAAERRAQVESVRADGVLGRARAYVAGLAAVLADEEGPPGERRFAQLAGATADSVGIDDAIWVESVPSSARSRYERYLGGHVSRVTRSGRFERARPAASYLAATFTSSMRPDVARGVDVSGWPALAAAIRNRANVFAVTASGLGSLGGEPGFYLLSTATFGSAPARRGFLVLFVPRGWLTTSLEDDPRRIRISLDGRRLEGGLGSTPAGVASFQALARRWQIDVGSEPPSGLQSLLPWLALAWPIAAALLALLIAGTIAGRRRAERDFERTFNLSLDMLCIAGLDGYFKRVNPAFERTLGYSKEELLSRPFADFVHPDDRAFTSEGIEALARGNELIGMEFENRYICADGSERWLQWSSRPVPQEGVMYGVAKDVTDRKRAEEDLRRARRAAEENRDALRLLAEEQAALRRVATLVARGVSPSNVFTAVSEEVGRLLGADSTELVRYEADGTGTVIAANAEAGGMLEVGTTLTLEGENSVSAVVLRTRQAARRDSYEQAEGPLAVVARAFPQLSTVGAPIVVEGRLWGVMIAAWLSEDRAPATTENRMAQFTELVGTAIANADTRTQLASSRARIVDAANEERRRVVRDLHDGAQQRLVHTVVTLKLARRALKRGGNEVEGLVSGALEHAERATSELRELAHGIHPAVLTRGGLYAAVDSLVSRLSLPVAMNVSQERVPPAIEANAYFVVSEALTNVVKHSAARRAEVRTRVEDGVLRIEIKDDGAGGAEPGRGSGLVGLRDRVETLGGRIEIVSPRGGGTSLRIEIPVDGG